MAINSEFATQLEAFYKHKSDNVPCVSNFYNQVLITHRKRMDKYGYWLDEKMSDRVNMPVHNFNKEDKKYHLTQDADHIDYQKTLVKDHKGLIRTAGEKMIYVATIDLLDKSVNEDTNVNCPNCGSAGPFSSFRDGCDYCGTHFEMSEVFPSIINYYLINDYYSGGGEDTVSNKVGNIFKAYAKLGHLVMDAGKEISKLKTVGNSNKDYETFMKEYRPDFSFVHFGSLAINMINLLVYSDDPTSLPFNAIPNCPVLLPNLIDMNFEGFGIYNKEYGIEGNIAKVKTIIYAKCFYEVEGQIKPVDEKFITTFQRDISKEVDLGYTMSAVNCQSCGSVFNLFNGTTCPYCSAKYELKDVDWVVTDIKRQV